MKKTILITGIALIGIIIVLMIIFFSSLNNGNGSTDNPRSGNIFDAIFPFGNSSGNGGANGGNLGENTDPIIDTRPVPRLRLIAENPTSGGAPFVVSEEEGDRTLINYMDRETGHLYETYNDNLTVRRISNTTIPGVQEMLWVNADEAIIRILSGNDIENFYLRLPVATTTQSVTGVFVGTWDRVALDADGSTLITVSNTESGSSVASVPPSGGTERTLYTSAISSWIPLQTNADVFIQTAPVSTLSGFLYRIVGGNLVKTLGDVRGLVANPNTSGSLVLYSRGGQGFSSLGVLTTRTGETTAVPFSSIATKCVWLPPEEVTILCGVPGSYPQGNYPEDWLQGSISFTDSLWTFDTTSGETKELVNIGDEYDVAIDVWQPKVNEDGSYLTFINKKDLSFWGFQIKEEETQP